MASLTPDPYVDFLAQIATVASCCVILSPASSIVGVMRSSPTAKEIKGFMIPYGMLYAQSFLWVFYGIATLNPPIVRINCLGSAISLVYLVILANHYPEPERKLVQSTLGACVTAMVVFSLLTIGLKNPEDREWIFAWSAIVFNVFLIVAPLRSILEVMQSSSLEGYPLGLTVCGFFSCVLWGEYSIATHSLLYLMPNLMGIVVNGFQLAVVAWIYFRYGPAPATSLAEAEAEEAYKEFFQAAEGGMSAKNPTKQGRSLLRLLGDTPVNIDWSSGRIFGGPRSESLALAAQKPVLAPISRTQAAQWSSQPLLNTAGTRHGDCLL